MGRRRGGEHTGGHTGERSAGIQWPAVQDAPTSVAGEIFRDAASAGRAAPNVSRSRRRIANKAAKRRKRRRSVAVVITAMVLVAGATYVGVDFLAPILTGSSSGTGVSDFRGPGHGSVQVTISQGDSGGAIGAQLVKAGVVATQSAFKDAYQANPRSGSIQPGTYDLMLEMPSVAAVATLLDPAHRVSYKVTVPEGYTAAQIYERVSSVMTIPVADLTAAAKDPAIALPAEAGGNVEGWLFPSTYQFEPGSTATSVLTKMVAKTVSLLDAKAVPVGQREPLLIKASLVQREGKSAEDQSKIARVINNRLTRPSLMPLQIDAAVAYGLHKSGTALTSADISSANTDPYNLYAHVGLPPTPIASPGEGAITAVLAPEAGDWLFWCTVNPDTGETLFATDQAGQDANVAKLRAWQAANPKK